MTRRRRSRRAIGAGCHEPGDADRHPTCRCATGQSVLPVAGERLATPSPPAGQRRSMPIPARPRWRCWSGRPRALRQHLRIASRLSATREMKVTVIPGLMSPQVLTAAHGIPMQIRRALPRHHRPPPARGGWPRRGHAGRDAGRRMFVRQPRTRRVCRSGGALSGWRTRSPTTALIEAGLAHRTAREAARAAHGWIMIIYLPRSLRQRP